MAAALVEMVAGLSLAKQPDGGDAAQQQGARDRAAAARVTLLQYAEDDAAAYTAFIEALRLPKNTNDEREVRTVAISSAAVRAAGSACANNAIMLVVPCHRVVKTGGALGNYAYGVDKKQWLLSHEGFL
jgi:O-6-methylguanine DNA methyltransferase